MTDDIDNLKQHKFDTSEYKTIAPRPCCIERDNLKAQLAEARLHVQRLLEQFGHHNKKRAVIEARAWLEGNDGKSKQN